MGRIIALASGKGGVGKTTITANLGISLAKRGKSVCLIDGDVAMANLSLLLGMHSSPITLHDVLLGESTIHDATYDAPQGMKFVPSGLSLESYKRADSERLENVVEEIKDLYDFILIDTPAGIEKNVLSVLAASDEVLLITLPNSASIADVLKTKITAQRLGAKSIGIILNFVYEEKGEIDRDDIMKMLELPVLASIPYDSEVRRSFMQDRVSPVMLRKPKTPAAIAIQRLAAKLTGPISMEDVERAKSKGNIISRFFGAIGGIFKRKKKVKKDDK